MGVHLRELIETTLGDCLGLRLGEVEFTNLAEFGFTAQNLFEMLTTVGTLARSHDIVDSCLRLDQPFKDMCPRFCLGQFELCSPADNFFTMADVCMEHDWQRQLNGFLVDDPHHVRRVRLLQPTGTIQLIQYCVGIRILFDFDDNTNPFFVRLIANVSDSLHGFLSHKFRNSYKHSRFLHLVWNLMYDNALSFVIIKHLTVGANMESSMSSFVHVANAIDAVNGGACGEIRTFQMLHIFTHIDTWWVFGVAIFLPFLQDSFNV